MRIFVSDGAGFIGSNVAHEYLRQDYEVAIRDNLQTGFQRNVNRKVRFYEKRYL
jgi:UDP-glucose 4-epimerase